MTDRIDAVAQDIVDRLTQCRAPIKTFQLLHDYGRSDTFAALDRLVAQRKIIRVSGMPATVELA